MLYALEGFAVGLFALLFGAVAFGGSGTDDAWKSLPPSQALAAAPCPEPESADFGNLVPEELEQARAGSFAVFGPEPTGLTVPVDWSDDPLAAHRYRQNLHKLRFLTPLLASYRDTGDTGDLEQALGLAVDWAEQNPRDARGTPVEAWSDKVTGDRVPYLAYLLRAAACEGLGSETNRTALSEAMAEHGEVLAADGSYTPDNHGLFVDLGLLRLTDFLPYLEQSPEWRALARERFEETLRGRLADGIWLEHSTGYQFLAIDALERMLVAYGSDPELEGLLAEMRASAGWFVEPDGSTVLFGDSEREPVPEWATAEASETGLFAAPDAGYAFARGAGPDGETGYLAVTDGFHNTTHKHADELSFELFDKGVSIVSDTGLYDKDPGPVRDFVVSNRSHSTLVVDGLDLPVGDNKLAYGSGLTATGSGNGWYAIEGENRLLEQVQDVSDRRLLLYRPGEMLLIVDNIGSDLPHAYTRYLQLGRDLDAIEGPAKGEYEIEPIGAVVRDGPSTVPVDGSKVRGQEEPLQGFTSPSFRRFVPRTTVAFAAQGTSEVLTTTIALDPALPAVDAIDESGAATTVTFEDGRTVGVTRGGETLSISDSAG